MAFPDQTDFFAAFLHELNQPLTTLRNVLELTTYRENNDWPAVIEAALSNVDRMVELLDLMGELSHFERLPLPSVSVDVAGLLREALEDLGASASMDGRHLAGTGMESAVWVLAAAEPLRSALFRIIADAVHNAREGETVRLALHPPSAPSLSNRTAASSALPASNFAVCEIGYAGPALAENESEALLGLAQTGHGKRGSITRRVFRLGLCLRVLVLQGAGVEVLGRETGDWVLRLTLPAAPASAPQL
jgi:hypothetical protein